MTATAKPVPERMLTELQRQDEYISELPENFEFPLFSGRQAVESQRKSGYQTTAHAAREIVDNAIEAGASNVWIALERISSDKREKYERKDAITAIALIDDGSGMRPKMARFALSWGGGTHTKDPDFIAKFGFGLPNSSINQTPTSTCPLTAMNVRRTKYVGVGLRIAIKPPSQLPSAMERR